MAYPKTREETTITSQRMSGLATMPFLEWLYSFLDHEIHHRGQLSLYLSHLPV